MVRQQSIILGAPKSETVKAQKLPTQSVTGGTARTLSKKKRRSSASQALLKDLL